MGTHGSLTASGGAQAAGRGGELFTRFRRQGRTFGCSALLVAAGAHAELTVSGVDKDVEYIVRAFVTVDELSCESPRWWVNRSFGRVLPEARLALETLGYYQATLEPALSWDEACWHATLIIDQGEAVQLGAVELSVQGQLGAEAEMLDVLAERPLRAGARFTHQSYESAKTRLLDVAEDLGYFDAHFVRAEVRVDPAAGRADVVLTLEGGQRYRVGAIEVEQDELRAELFERFLRIEPGRLFDAHDLAATYRNLLDSQYFDRVLVSPDLDAREDGRVPVRVSAETTNRRSILLGAGYATDTGPRARADVRYRRLNDRGHRASVATLVSGNEGEVKADYRVPMGDPTREWLYAETALSYEDTGNYLTRLWTVTGGRTHRRGADWLETNYVDHRIEDFDLGGERGHSQLLLLGSSWTRKTITDDPRPLAGYTLSLDLRGAADALYSDIDLLQAIARARHIYPLGPRVRVLSRAAAGWTWQESFSDLPPSIRFYAGGDSSVRGYAYESIGRERNGDVLGGQRLLTGSVELDVLLREKWSAAVFADAGSAFDDSPDFSRGVGVGVRWYSPLGPLRFDLAHPLDDPDNSIRIHVTLGPDL